MHLLQETVLQVGSRVHPMPAVDAVRVGMHAEQLVRPPRAEQMAIKWARSPQAPAVISLFRI